MKHPQQPAIAIVAENTLAALGLKRLLQMCVPFAQIEIFNSPSVFEQAQPERFFHFFVDPEVLKSSRFLLDNIRRVILISPKEKVEMYQQTMHVKTISFNVTEEELVKSILELLQYGHPKGKNMPTDTKKDDAPTLSKREIEVLRLIVKGFINKEIADKLNIGLTTVITHRQNITKKLSAKSVSSLTIYAVMNGFVNIDEI